LPLLFAWALAGCAGVSHRSIASKDADLHARGFRYYDAAPYLLVQTNGTGGLTTELKWLPDRSKLRQATPYQFLAKNDSTFTFTGGVLTGSDSVGDGTAIPKAFIEAAEKTISAGLKAGLFDDPSAPKTRSIPRYAPRVYLFKIVKIDGEWTLLGAEGTAPSYRTLFEK
jgi:hypothetical protein